MSHLSDTLSFVFGFTPKNWHINGSILPSSRTLTANMLSGLDFERIRCIVEFGPGVGTFTHEIVRRLAPGARLVLIEINPVFITRLRELFRGNDSIIVIEGSADDLPRILSEQGLGRPDAIISGLPFASLPRDIAERIIVVVRGYVSEGTIFRTFTYRFPKIDRLFRDCGLPLRKLSHTFHNFPPAHTLGTQ